MSEDFGCKRVTVMGLGRFGGGAGVCRWLAQQGADVLLTDLQSAEKLTRSLREIHDLIDRGQVALRLGEHNVSDFTSCDLVVASPAVPMPWQNRFLRSAAAAGVPITTEIRLTAERLNRDRVIGVTGTAGKSTTTAMIHYILRSAGLKAHCGGNIGGSLLGQLQVIEPEDWIVLELSSAMLYWLDEGAGAADAIGWSPHIGLITNIAPNHLDWHGAFEHYRHCKGCIHRHMRKGDLPLLGESAWGSNATDAPPMTLRVIGRHNLENARMACWVASDATGMDLNRCRALVADFPGLPHRLQFVAERDGLRFYNDSKSTTPGATVLALDAFEDPATVHLIAGGYDKGSDLAPVARLSGKIAALYTIGATGPMLAAAARSANSRALVEHCDTLDAAVRQAIPRMQHGDVLLLSPACASWDQFANYEERGEAFCRLVGAHAATVGAVSSFRGR